MIKKVRIRNFRAIEDIELELRPFQVFIGQNNSGKTSFLDALVSLQRMTQVPVFQAWTGDRFDFARNLRLGVKPPEISWEIETMEGARYALTVGVVYRVCIVRDSLDGMPEEAAYQRSWADDKSWRADPPQIQGDPGPDSLWLHRSPEASSLFALLSSMHRFTLQPRAMCRAVEADAALEEDGDGFPALLDRLQNIAPEIFEDLQERVRRAFPGVRYIRTPPVPGGLRELAVAEAGAPGLVYGAQLSDGLLLLIGYLALALAPGIRTLVLMLDEPEMGLHMERSNFLVDLMRRLSKGEFGRPVQVILTTHSPDVVDFLSPDEVVVFERSAGGSIHAQRLSDVPDLRARLKGFNLGEYWSSYGEAGLLRGEEG